MVDCGADWLAAVTRIAPAAIVLTHAHADHAFGLARGAACPVYATSETWALIARFPIEDRRIVRPGAPFDVGGVTFEAFEVHHSLRAPAVGYRIGAGPARAFYVPDVAAIERRRAALRGVDLYIGDGATIARSMVRMRGGTPIGHAPIAAQLGWCKAEAVARAIFTHCGSGIVKAATRAVEARIREMGAAAGVAARVAYDGLTISL
jgi:phosphoribosyl 1,2-cyclic phosphodiesterase